MGLPGAMASGWYKQVQATDAEHDGCSFRCGREIALRR